MALSEDDIIDLIHSTLVCKPDINEFPKNYMNIVGQPFAEAKRTIGINHLNDLATRRPDKFCIRGGSVTAIKSDEIGGVVDHMDRTVSKSKSRGSRGGSRGGRAGGTSGRGGYQGNYGAAFSSAPPRGGAARGGGIGFRGGSTRGGNSFSSDFGASSRGGFGSGGATSAFRGGNDSFGGGGFNDSRRRDPSPPRKEYSTSGRGGETSFNSRSDNRGFSSNYDNFAETSRRRGSDDYDDRGYNRRDDRYDDRYNDRGRDRDYDDDYDNDRGRRDDREPLKMTRTVTNEFYDDSRGGGSSSHRGGDRDRDGYSNRDDGYRTQQSRRYSADEEDDWDNRRRDDRDERGGGRGREEYGRGRDYDDRHSSHDDRFHGGYEVEERGRDTGEERRGFPSAFNRPSDRPLFAPKPMSDEDEGVRGGGSYRRSGDTPPDPVRAREPCGPTDMHIPVPPGFEHLLVDPRNAPPPGLGYPGQKIAFSPPPGLDPVANPPRDPVRDPMKKTPSQRDHELEPEHVPIDELEQLVFSALQRQGGRDVEYDKIIGLILKHCRRDMSEVVLQHGGASPAMEKVCRRSERLEFETNDDGVDVVRLKEPFRAEAWEKYGRKDAHGPDYVSDDDETESAVSYQSARSSQAERQSVRSSQFERQSVRSAAKPASVANSEAPAEIKQADEIWNFVRSNNYARYCSEVGGYEMPMLDVERYKPKMNAKQLYMFLSRPAYMAFFQIRFYDEKSYVYAMGERGPASVLLDNKERAGGSERMRDERDVRGGSTVSSGRGAAGGAQRVDRDAAAPPPPPRPSAYAFYFREDDPEDGREKLAPGRFKTREQVMLTTFNDFFDFYVMSLRDYDKAQQMGSDLYDDHKDMRHCDIAEWEKGFVGCHIPEGQARGYRATVVAVDHDKQQLKLFYVDFGTTVFANYLDVVPLRDSYKKYALCYRCSMEYFTEIDADDLWSARKSAKQLKNLEVTIEPLERRWEEKVLIVELTFVPPGDFSTGPRTYPTDLYRKRLAEPPVNTFSDIYR